MKQLMTILTKMKTFRNRVFSTILEAIMKARSNRVLFTLRGTIAGAMVILFALAAPAAFAGTLHWTGGYTGANASIWSNSANWGGAAWANDSDVIFENSNINNTLATYLGGNKTVKSITFASNAAGAFTVRLATTKTGGTAATLTFIAGNTGIAVQAGDAYSHTIGVSDGSVVLAGNLAVNHNGSGTLTIDRPITGGFALTKDGTGTFVLSSANTYSGGTTISGGTLRLSGAGTINSSSGITIVGDGAKFLHTGSTAVSPTVTLTQGTLTGSGTVNTVVVGAGTGGVISNNNGAAGAALTVGSLTFSGAATVNAFVNITSAAIVTTSLATNAAGTVTINPSAASWTGGATYDLISYGGGSIGGAGFGQFVLGTFAGLPTRQTPTGLTDTGTAVAMVIPAYDNPYWLGDGDGKWNLASTNNWKLVTAGTYTTFMPGDDALFNDSAGGAGPISVDIDAANVATLSTTFSNSTKDYVLGSSGGYGISSGSLTKNGAGTVTITTVNAYTGATTINGGTLQIAGAGSLGSGAYGGGITNNGVFRYSSSAAQTLSGAITGTGSLVKDNSTGTLTLSGSNTYTGGTTLSAGTLIIGNAGALGAGRFTIAGAGTVAAAGTIVITNPVDGNSNFSIGGTGALTLGGTMTLNASRTITNNNITSATTFGAISGGGGSYTTTFSGDGSTAVTGIIDTGSGGLTKSGTGKLTLLGTNTYTGMTSINAGVLVFGKQTVINGDIANFTPANVTVESGAVMGLALGNSGAGYFDSAAIDTVLDATHMGTSDSTTGMKGGAQIGLDTTNVVGGVFTHATAIGDLSGGNSIGLAKLGAGTLALSGANAYTGGTAINAGSLSFLNTAAMPSTGAVTVEAGATLGLGVKGGDASYFSATDVDNLFAGTFVGSLSNVSANATSNVGIDTTAGDFVYVSSVPSSTRGLTKLGANTLTLSGDNAYTGGTTISNGTLQFAKLVSMPASGAVAVKTGTTLLVNVGGPGEWTTDTNGNGTIGGLLAGLGGQSGGTVSYSGNVTLGLETTGTQTYSGTIGNVGSSLSLSKSGSGTLVLSAGSDYSYTGATTVNAGTLAVNSLSSNGFKSTNITINNGGTVRLDAADKVVDTAAITVNAGGTLDMNGFSETIAKLQGSGNVTSTAAASTLILKNGGSYTFSGVISGDGLSLTYYQQDGTLTLSGQSTYGGATQVGAQSIYRTTVKLGANNALPSGTPVTVDGQGENYLDLAGFNQTIGLLTLGSYNGGARGQVINSTGSSTLTLTNGVSCDGHNNGNAGIYVTTVDLNGSTQTFSVPNGNAAIDLDITSVIQNGGLTMIGNVAAAALGLSGANTFSGQLTILKGMLAINTINNASAAGPLGNSELAVILGGSTSGQTGTLWYTGATAGSDKPFTMATTAGGIGVFQVDSGAATLTLSGVIDGSGAMSKTGPGTLTLGGNNAYTGLTTVSAGWLVLSGSDNSAATGGMTINAGAAQFESPGSINGTLRNVTVNSGGAVVFGAAFDAGNIPTALSTRIVASSAGAIAADNYGATNFDFDTPGLTAASLGAVGSVTYTGTLTPNGTAGSAVYRLGGGGGMLTMANANAVTGSGHSLIVTGPGTVVLAAANNYTGGTTLNAGTLGVSNDNSIGSGTLTFNGGAISSDSATARTIANAVAFTGNGGLGDAVNTGKLTFTNTADLGSATRTVTLASDAELAGVVSGIGGGLTKAGTGTLTLSGADGSYTGVTSITAGTLSVSKLADGGLPSSIGASTNVSTNLLIGSGATLQYTGAGDITNRQFRFNGSLAGLSITLDASGTGPINFTNTAGPTHSNSNQARTLNLIGSNTGENTLAAPLANNGTGALGLTKNGVGTWVLSGANTYTGATTVNNGTLLVNEPGSLAAGSTVTVNAGALGGNGVIGGAVTVKTGGSLAPGASAGTLTINNNLTMEAGATYVWQLGSTAADMVDVNGTLSIPSSWTLSLANAGGTLGTEYNLFTYDSFPGTFTAPTIDYGSTGWSGAAVALDTVGSRIYLKFGKPGDTNGDNVVDAADFITLKKNFGKSTGAGVTAGDFDKTGTVDWADLGILMNNMGTGGGTHATAPEPCSAILLMFGAAAMLRKRRA